MGTVVLKYRERGSMTRLNSRGDRGHPCLVPLCSLIALDCNPDAITVADGDEYKFCMKY